MHTHKTDVGPSVQCRFCQPGMLTRPARDVEPSRVVDAVEQGMRTTVRPGCLPPLVLVGQQRRWQACWLRCSGRGKQPSGAGMLWQGPW